MDGRFGADMISGQPLRNRHRDIIFTNIVRIEPSNGERFQSRMPDRRQIIAIEQAPFWQAASRNREAMGQDRTLRSEEHTSEHQSLMSTSYAGFCWKTKQK